MPQRLPHSCYMPPSAKSGGFSLVELMIVIMILAVLASFATPTMENMIVQNRLTSQTNELLGAIQFARGEAIKRNQRIRFCSAADADDAACDPGALNWAHWIVLNANDTVLRRGSIPANLMVSSGLINNTLTFSPSGLSDVTGQEGNSDSQIIVCSPTGNGDTTRFIWIRIAGGTRIERLDNGGCA